MNASRRGKKTVFIEAPQDRHRPKPGFRASYKASDNKAETMTMLHEYNGYLIQGKVAMIQRAH